MLNLKNFRTTFIDAQNNAEFSKAAKLMIKEVRNAQLDERIDNYNEGDFMEFYISPKQIIIFWHLDNKSNAVYLNKGSKNYYEKIDYSIIKEKIQGKKMNKLTIEDINIFIPMMKMVKDLFTGDNFDEM